jgi:two-component system, sensor histidine kinase and response regulator
MRVYAEDIPFVRENAQMSQSNLPLILAVDDEPANLALLERLLKSQYRIMSVNSGQGALDMLVQAPFDLVLLDIMMPGMNGLEVLENIRRTSSTSDLPVILISALTEIRDITYGLELGANDYITKPIDLDVTQARVQTQISLKLLQDERKAAIVRLEEAQEMKNRFVRMASHDLKGPLMSLRMIFSLLPRKIELDPGIQELMDAADSTLDTMHMVIKDFLDTAALQSSEMDLHLGQLSVEQMVNELVTEHSINSNRKNIGLSLGEVSGSIYADAARFRQALGNLISNAIKYSPPDTTVQIWSECTPDTVQIFVADQGPGIPLEEQGRLFTEFGKLSPRPTGGEASTGLGLWIVKHLINLQHGQVGLISPPEGGSIFWIEMPAA